MRFADHSRSGGGGYNDAANSYCKKPSTRECQTLIKQQCIMNVIVTCLEMENERRSGPNGIRRNGSIFWKYYSRVSTVAGTILG